MSQNIVSVTLRNGAAMPLVGLGTWKAEKGVVGKAVRANVPYEAKLNRNSEKEGERALRSRMPVCATPGGISMH